MYCHQYSSLLLPLHKQVGISVSLRKQLQFAVTREIMCYIQSSLLMVEWAFSFLSIFALCHMPLVFKGWHCTLFMPVAYIFLCVWERCITNQFFFNAGNEEQDNEKLRIKQLHIFFAAFCSWGQFDDNPYALPKELNSTIWCNILSLLNPCFISN